MNELMEGLPIGAGAIGEGFETGKETKHKTSMVWREGKFHAERRAIHRGPKTFVSLRDEPEDLLDGWLVGGIAAMRARAIFL